MRMAARPLHIGFLSKHLCNHTIGDLTKGLIHNLSRPDFEVTPALADLLHLKGVQAIRWSFARAG